MTTLTSQSDVVAQLELLEFVPGRKAQVRVLERLLPDVETALFFAKALGMDYTHLSTLLTKLFKTSVVNALFGEGELHSTELQDYLIDTVPESVWPVTGSGHFDDDVEHAEILPELWDAIDVEIASSIAQVAEKLSYVLDALPSKEGSMTFTHMAKLNKQRPTIGVYAAQINHAPVQPVLVILDVSGSMGEETVRRIAADVVELGWKADAHLAIVSDTAQLWEPGTFNVADVLAAAEYSGTHYEKLAPLFDQDWGTVITIADYDSAASAGQWIRNHSTGRIGRVLDLSLVDRPTYLAEVVGQLASEVTPLLVAKPHAGLTA
jgi:hypothetical protein